MTFLATESILILFAKCGKDYGFQCLVIIFTVRKHIDFAFFG